MLETLALVMKHNLGASRHGKEELRQRLDLRERIREILRTDDGQVELVGATRRRMPCETFRNQLGLLSCPDSIAPTGGQWEFSGKGEGHGLGLDLTAANVRAAEGRELLWILSRFFPGAILAREPR